jgi:hypothetical protein
MPQPTRILFTQRGKPKKNNPKFGIKKPGAMRRVFCALLFGVRVL